MKKYKIMYYSGAAISLLVGLWHFTVPWMFGWASYIPYETLVVPINYVNLCFSFLLSGLILTVILWGKKVFAKNSEAFYIYFFACALDFPCGCVNDLSLPAGIKCVDVLRAAERLCSGMSSAACTVYPSGLHKEE